MVRFYLAMTLVHIGEWFAKAAINLAGGRGYIDIQFEMDFNRLPYQLVGWLFVFIAFVLAGVLL